MSTTNPWPTREHGGFIDDARTECVARFGPRRLAMASITDRRWVRKPGGQRVSSGYSGRAPWRVRWTDPITGREKSRHFARKLEAERFATDVEARKATGEYVDPRAGRIRFDEVATRWLATVSHLKPNTVAGYESILTAHLLPAFASAPVASIDTTTVKSFTSKMFADGKSYQTVRNALNVLRAVLATAVESRLLATNPAAGLRLDRARAKRARQARREERVFLSAAQVDELAEAMPEPFGIVVTFAAYTGVRAGELAALRVADVDLERARLHVRRSVAEVHGQLVEGDPKSGEARTLSLPRFLVSELRGHFVATGYRDHEFLFPAERGGQLRQSNFYRRMFKPAVEATSHVPDALRFHDLRHTCAAMLIAEGAHPKAIQQRLGHSSIEVTMDTYGHLYESAEDALADALDAVHAASTAVKAPRLRAL
jgi:integrase